MSEIKKSKQILKKSTNQYSDFNIELNKKNEDNFPYKDINLENITFNKPNENIDFENLSFSKPIITTDYNYLGIIGNSLIKEDKVFIWKLDNIEKPIYNYEAKKILTLDFSPDNQSFILITDNNATHYNINDGKKIVDLTLNNKINNTICSCFSQPCNFYALATENELLIWDIKKGKILLNFKEKSPMKFINLDILISISDKGFLKIITIGKQKILVNCQIENVQKNTEILTCLTTQDKKKIYYILKQGVYCIDIDYSKGNNYQFKSKSIIKFDDIISNNHISSAKISQDCKKFIITDYETIFIFDMEKGLISNILNQQFKDFFYSFTLSKIVLLDDNHINIKFTKEDENNEKPQINIWLNNTFSTIDSFKYIENYSIFLVIVDEHSACIFDCEKGNLIYKWYNPLPMWYKSISLTPEDCDTTLISVKTTNNLVYIYDYTDGTEILPLIGVNAYTCCFSDDGNNIALGCVEGDIIAMLFNLNDTSISIPFYNKGNKNLNTTVKFTNNSLYLICISENQEPLLFDIENQNLIKTFKCDVSLDFINEVNMKHDEIFYVKGYKGKTPIAILFTDKREECLKVFKNCQFIDITNDSKYCVTHISNKNNQNENVLYIWDIDLENYNLISKDIPLDVNENFLFNDNKCMYSVILRFNEKRFVLINLKNGEMIGEIIYSQLSQNKNYIIELNVSNQYEDILVLRRYEFK